MRRATVVALVIGLQGAWVTEAALSTNRLASNRLAQNKLAANRLAANRLAQNRLASNRLASNRLAANRLAQNKLAAHHLEAVEATSELLSTPDGREVYSYIVGCALDASVTIEAEVPGAQDSAPPETPYTCENESCVFEGSLGLAPHWVDRKLEPKGQRWVSACLFARVNLHERAVTISLRGLAPELTVSDEEAEQFPLEEGAFFGNLFTGDDEPIDWNACRGRDQAAGELGSLDLRDCAEPDPADPDRTLCGFQYAGDCGDFSAESLDAQACKSYDDEDGIYGECRASDGDGRSHSSRPYREVITVFVSN